MKSDSVGYGFHI